MGSVTTAPRIKFCGVTNVDDARLCAEAGAWALGMIFWPCSERRCKLSEAEEIAAAMRRRVELAGVFVNAPLDDVARVADVLGLTLVQLHGDEGPAFCAEVARRTGAKVIKAMRVRGAADLQALDAFHTDFHLLDAYVPGKRGGTGETFDWELVAARRSGIPLILSGGLTPEQRGGRHRGDAAVRGRRGQRHRGAPGRQGPGQARGLRRRGPRHGRGGARMSRRRRAPLRPLRRPVRARDADARARRARGGVAGGVARRRLPGVSRALLRDYAGRPTPLYLAERLSEAAGHEIWLKREDLMHTGSHKLNNALGQALLAKRMGKTRIIAETGAGQHGVASATACALLDLECIVYMGAEDIRRQQPNVQRMELLGATVSPVEAGARTLKEAVSEAIRDWVANVADTHYIIGSAVGPAPYPTIVRDLQRVIGDEARARDPRARRAPARPRDRVRGRRLELDRPVRGLRRRRERRAGRRRGGGRGARRPPRRAAHRGRPPRACCTGRCRRSCRTTRARSSRPTRSPPAWTTRAPGPSTPGCATPAAPATWP